MTRRIGRFATRALAVAAALAGGALAARSDESPPPSATENPIISLDGGPPPAVPTASRAARATVPPPSDAAEPMPPTPASALLAPLEPADRSGAARLVGEFAEAEFRVVLPDDASADALVLAYRAGIDVLPDESRIEVTVNGVALPAFAPTISDATTIAVLPAQALRTGENVVRVAVRLHHRIYCGAEASFALWTEIDLALSGARLARGGAPTETTTGMGAVRLAFARQMASGAPLELRVGPGAPEAAVRAAAVAVARAARRSAPPIRVASVWAPATGEAAAMRIALLDGPVETIAAVRAGDGALVLRVVSPFDDPGRLLTRLASLLPEPAPTIAPPLASAGASTSLAAFAETPVALKGRYAHRAARFALPDDWLALASSRARLELSYEVPRLYPAGAAMSVTVNGEAVRLLPLDRAAVSPLQIDFDAQLLRRGVNVIAFETIAPGDPADRPCPVGEGPLSTTVSGETRLVLPRAPRMVLPGMAPAALGIDGEHVVAAAATDALRFAGLPPIGDADPTTLRVVRLDAARGARPELPNVDPAALRAALDRSEQGDRAASPPEASGVASVAFAARAALDWLRASVEILDARPLERGASLEDWLARTPGVAALLQPDRERPRELWLILGPHADIDAVALALETGRASGRGPDGQAAILTASGDWRSWFAPMAAPELRERPSLGDLRAAAGNFAAWSPPLFVVGGVGATWLSAFAALAFVRASRKRDDT